MRRWAAGSSRCFRYGNDRRRASEARKHQVCSRKRPASTGEIGPDGRFTLTCYDGKDGALPGKHRVQVDANRGISEKKMEIFTPKHYADFRTSGIEIVIDKAVDDLKIELTWGKEKKGPYIETLYSGS